MTDKKVITLTIPEYSCECGQLRRLGGETTNRRVIDGVERSVCTLCDTPLRDCNTGELFDEYKCVSLGYPNEIGDIDTRPFSVPWRATEADIDRIMEAAHALTDSGEKQVPGNSENLVKELTDFREAFEGLLMHEKAPAANSDIAVMKFRQALGNMILWYGWWEKNRDYSAVINASMALGKLSMATDFLQQQKAIENNPDYDTVVDVITEICSECWARIGAGVGRIVPFK